MTLLEIQESINEGKIVYFMDNLNIVHLGSDNRYYIVGIDNNSILELIDRSGRLLYAETCFFTLETTIKKKKSFLNKLTSIIW